VCGFPYVWGRIDDLAIYAVKRHPVVHNSLLSRQTSFHVRIPSWSSFFPHPARVSTTEIIFFWTSAEILYSSERLNAIILL
jgi:hypothetical protein